MTLEYKKEKLSKLLDLQPKYFIYNEVHEKLIFDKIKCFIKNCLSAEAFCAKYSCANANPIETNIQHPQFGQMTVCCGLLGKNGYGYFNLVFKKPTSSVFSFYITGKDLFFNIANGGYWHDINSTKHPKIYRNREKEFVEWLHDTLKKNPLKNKKDTIRMVEAYCLCMFGKKGPKLVAHTTASYVGSPVAIVPTGPKN